MQDLFTSQKFLEYLNEDLRVKAPDVIVEKNRDECSGDLFAPDTLDFAIPADLIIVGPCSGWGFGDGAIGVINQNEYNEDFPMGGCIVEKGAPDKSWLHAILADQNPQPKSIVAYPTCCGSYRESYKEMIRRIFPNFTWHFPDVKDFYDAHHADEVAASLVAAGILKIVPELAA